MKQLALGMVDINVMSVEKALLECIHVTSRDILLLTLVKNHSNVTIVRNLLHRKKTWFDMKHVTLGKVYINVSNVEKAF